GLGFAKTFEQNLELMRQVGTFADVGRPVLVGPSRKSFIGRVTGRDVGDRGWGTAGAVAWLVAHGVHVLRVHDVWEMVDVVRVVEAIASVHPAELGSPSGPAAPRRGPSGGRSGSGAG